MVSGHWSICTAGEAKRHVLLSPRWLTFGPGWLIASFGLYLETISRESRPSSNRYPVITRGSAVHKGRSRSSSDSYFLFSWEITPLRQPIRSICKQRKWECWQTEVLLAPPEEEKDDINAKRKSKEIQTNERILITGCSVSRANPQEPVSRVWRWAAVWALRSVRISWVFLPDMWSLHSFPVPVTGSGSLGPSWMAPLNALFLHRTHFQTSVMWNWHNCYQSKSW